MITHQNETKKFYENIDKLLDNPLSIGTLMATSFGIAFSKDYHQVLKLAMDKWWLSARIKEYITYPELYANEMLFKEHFQIPKNIIKALETIQNRRIKKFHNYARSLSGYPSLAWLNFSDTSFNSSYINTNSYPFPSDIVTSPAFYFYNNLDRYNLAYLEAKNLFRYYIQQVIGYRLTLISSLFDDIDILTETNENISVSKTIQYNTLLERVCHDITDNPSFCKIENVTVTSVYDGDTFHGKIGNAEPIPIRIAMIDAPELKVDGIETEEGIKSRNILRKKLKVGSTVTLIINKHEAIGHYGRLVAYVRKGTIDISTYMLENDLNTKLFPSLFWNEDPYAQSIVKNFYNAIKTKHIDINKKLKKQQRATNSLYKDYTTTLRLIKKQASSYTKISPDLQQFGKNIIDDISINEQRFINGVYDQTTGQLKSTEEIMKYLDTPNAQDLIELGLVKIEAIRAYFRLAANQKIISLYNTLLTELDSTNKDVNIKAIQNALNLPNIDIEDPAIQKQIKKSIDKARERETKIKSWLQYLQTILLQQDKLNIARSAMPVLGQWGQITMNSLYTEKKVLDSLEDSLKYNSYGIERAFPTFKLFFVEEDNTRLLAFNDFYSYNAIQEIKIIKSRKSASTVAQLKISNVSNILSPDTEPSIEYYGIDIPNIGSITENVQDTTAEQTVHSFILQPGTEIIIKLGYSNNPNELETVFVGKITETNIGETIDIVAQDYGSVLSETIAKYQPVGFRMFDDYRTHGDVIGYILRNINTHAKLGAFSIFDDVNGMFTDSHFSRRFLSRFIASNMLPIKLNYNDALSDNVYLQTGGKVYAAVKNTRTFSWYINNQTAFEAINEILLWHPDYIVRVLPYNDNLYGETRQTIYIGPKDGTYKKSDTMNIFENMFLNDISNNLLSLVKKYKKEVEESTESSYAISTLLNKYINDLPDKIKNNDKALDMYTSLFKFDILMAARGTRPIATSIWSNFNVHYSRNANGITDNTMIFVKNYVKSALNSGDTFSNLPSSVLSSYRSMLNTGYKRVTQSHFYDSYHNIILNNIKAGSANFYNKVTMFYPSNNPVSKPEDVTSGTPFRRFLARKVFKWISILDKIDLSIDDDIFKEEIREYQTFQKNIDAALKDYATILTDSVKYLQKTGQEYNRINYDLPKYGLPVQFKVAANILSKLMKDMYSGELVIIGDPTVNPYDTVYIYDTYNNMTGIIDVEQVVQIYNAQQGFYTVITPDLRTKVENKNSFMYEPLIGWVQTFLSNVNGIAGYTGLLTGLIAGATTGSTTGPLSIAGVPIMAGVGAIVGAIGGYFGAKAVTDKYWRKTAAYVFGRNLVDFTGLWYGNKPFVAGLRGMRRNSIYNHTVNRVTTMFPKIRIGMGE